jgi:hypothetical protein
MDRWPFFTKFKDKHLGHILNKPPCKTVKNRGDKIIGGL